MTPPRPDINGESLIPRTVRSDAFKVPRDGKYGIEIEAWDGTNKKVRAARLWWDAAANQLKCTYRGTTYTIGP